MLTNNKTVLNAVKKKVCFIKIFRSHTLFTNYQELSVFGTERGFILVRIKKSGIKKIFYSVQTSSVFVVNPAYKKVTESMSKRYSMYEYRRIQRI